MLRRIQFVDYIKDNKIVFVAFNVTNEELKAFKKELTADRMAVWYDNRKGSSYGIR